MVATIPQGIPSFSRARVVYRNAGCPYSIVLVEICVLFCAMGLEYIQRLYRPWLTSLPVHMLRGAVQFYVLSVEFLEDSANSPLGLPMILKFLPNR